MRDINKRVLSTKLSAARDTELFLFSSRVADNAIVAERCLSHLLEKCYVKEIALNIANSFVLEKVLKDEEKFAILPIIENRLAVLFSEFNRDGFKREMMVQLAYEVQRVAEDKAGERR